MYFTNFCLVLILFFVVVNFDVALGQMQKGQWDCQANEVYVHCGTCEGSCKRPIIPECSKDCRIARCECIARNGYVRAHDGTCIKQSDCAAYHGVYFAENGQRISNVDIGFLRKSFAQTMQSDIKSSFSGGQPSFRAFASPLETASKGLKKIGSDTQYEAATVEQQPETSSTDIGESQQQPASEVATAQIDGQTGTSSKKTSISVKQVPTLMASLFEAKGGEAPPKIPIAQTFGSGYDGGGKKHQVEPAQKEKESHLSSSSSSAQASKESGPPERHYDEEPGLPASSGAGKGGETLSTASEKAVETSKQPSSYSEERFGGTTAAASEGPSSGAIGAAQEEASSSSLAFESGGETASTSPVSGVSEAEGGSASTSFNYGGPQEISHPNDYTSQQQQQSSPKHGPKTSGRQQQPKASKTGPVDQFGFFGQAAIAKPVEPGAEKSQKSQSNLYADLSNSQSHSGGTSKTDLVNGPIISKDNNGVSVIAEGPRHKHPKIRSEEQPSSDDTTQFSSDQQQQQQQEEQQEEQPQASRSNSNAKQNIGWNVQQEQQMSAFRPPGGRPRSSLPLLQGYVPIFDRSKRFRTKTQPYLYAFINPPPTKGEKIEVVDVSREHQQEPTVDQPTKPEISESFRQRSR